MAKGSEEEPVLSEYGNQMVNKILGHHRDSQAYLSSMEVSSRLSFGNEFGEFKGGMPKFEQLSQPEKQRQCMIKLTYITTQLIVEFAKKVPGFELLDVDKKVTNLKSAASEIMIIRTADRYQISDKKIQFQDNSLVDRQAFNTLVSENANYVDPMFNWCDRMKRELQVDMTEICLLACICLFKPDRPGMIRDAGLDHVSFNNRMLAHYKNVLRAYQQQQHVKVKNKFERLLRELEELKGIATEQNKMLHTFKKGMLPKLLGEELWSQHVQD